MSFYVTLPSNSSLQTYSSNTHSDFVTILNPALVLNSNYEVALVELIIGDSYYNNIGSIKIKNPFWKYYFDKNDALNNLRKEFIKIDINIHTYDNSYKLFENLTESVNQSIIKEEYMCRYNYYINILKRQTFVIINSNSKYELPVRDYDSKDKTTNVIFEIDNFLRLSKFKFKFGIYLLGKQLKITNPTSIQFDGPILEIFNIKRSEYIGDVLININLIKLSINNNIYVYTDIIHDQYIGNDMKPLLKIVSLTNNNDTSYLVNNPQYYKLIKQFWKQ